MQGLFSNKTKKDLEGGGWYYSCAGRGNSRKVKVVRLARWNGGGRLGIEWGRGGVSVSCHRRGGSNGGLCFGIRGQERGMMGRGWGQRRRGIRHAMTSGGGSGPAIGPPAQENRLSAKGGDRERGERGSVQRDRDRDTGRGQRGRGDGGVGSGRGGDSGGRGRGDNQGQDSGTRALTAYQLSVHMDPTTPVSPPTFAWR